MSRLAARTGVTRPLLWGTFCSVLVVLVATGGGSAIAAPRTDLQLTTVEIVILPLEPTALAVYAKQRGFFRKQGIDAKITVLADPAQIVAAVLSGEAQFSSLNTGGAAILKSRGAPVRVIAAGALYRPKFPTTAVVAAPGKRITRARDLVGKHIAIDATNTIAHIGLLKWLARNGISADAVEISTIPFAQMIGPLTQGTIDAALLPEPFWTLATQRGARRLSSPFDAVCAQDCLLTIWMGRKDVDPNLAARFRNAIQAAAVWANDPRNQRASGAILAGYTSLDPALVSKIRRSAFATRLRLRLAQPWIDAFAEFKLLPESFAAADLLK